MTALVAVMNKQAVALAADSAGTVQMPGSKHAKIYPMNKLFALSKQRPVGAMICGNSQFLGLPWESVIKRFRASSPSRAHGYLAGWRDEFIAFLSGLIRDLPIPQKERDQSIIERYARLVVRVSKVCGPPKEGEPEEAYAPRFEAIWDQILAEQETAPELFPVSDDEIVGFLLRHGEGLKSIDQAIFTEQKLPVLELEPKRAKAIRLIATRPFGSASQVVIAGFGDEEWFPGIVQLHIDGAFGDHLRCWCGDQSGIGWENPAQIVPFAQGDVIASFMEGAHPQIRNGIMSFLNRSLKANLPGFIGDLLKDDIEDEARRKAICEQVCQIGDTVLQELSNHWDKAALEQHSTPVMYSVAHLGKDELALLAESLIMTTSLKRRMDIEATESVGGPIDVAVISRTEGFIWIKRKHYFEVDLNPNFRDRQASM
ncbi:MAG: hypothetical protein L6R48_10820 [Planctomycetes bacterium]|nr:hypothetical protein [Planctomycetota bacterium]